MKEHVWMRLDTAELVITGSPVDMIFNDGASFPEDIPPGVQILWLGEL